MKNIFFTFVAFFFYPAMSVAADIEEAPASKRGVQLTIDDLRTFTDVFNQIRSNFVEEKDDHSLLVAAIEGMLSKLDPWSVFLDSEESQELANSSMGRYGGIGVSLDLRDWRIIVDSVTPGGPAETAGVLPGDLVTSVEGKPVRGRKVFESVDALMGEPGTEVSVRFKTGSKRSRELRLTREFIPVTSVISELLPGNIAYFEITHFHRNTHLELESSIKTEQANSDNPLAGIILDLRGNPGGVILPAVEIADGFLDQGMIVFTKGRYQASLLEFRAHQGQWASGIPLVILTDGKTASASEVLTGALQDHGRAVIIGEKTFGKGSIQSVFTLRNGSTLKLTTAHYFTPSGKTIHELGIEPDIAKKTTSEMLAFVTGHENDGLIHAARRYFESLSSGLEQNSAIKETIK